MEFAENKTIESSAVPGVRFTIRVLNQFSRAKRDFPVADQRLQYTDLIEQYNRAIKGYEKLKMDEVPAEQRALIRSLDYKAGLIMDQHLKPATLKASLVSIEENVAAADAEPKWKPLERNGKKVDAATLIDSAPDALVNEIFTNAEILSGLSARQSENFQSPSDSPDPGDTENPLTIATDASTKGSTSGKTASAAISQAA